MSTIIEQYIDLDGNLITVPELTWLEDGRDNDGNNCARYATGNESSVWLDWNDRSIAQEVETW